MPVDEAIVTLAEAILMVGLVVLAHRLWLSYRDPYPALVAKVVNATVASGPCEVYVALPRPAYFEEGGYRVCYAGDCYRVSVPLRRIGAAWSGATVVAGSATVTIVGEGSP